MADGILSYFILIWLDFTPMNGFVGGIMFGLLSLFGVQAIVSPRRLLAFRLAWQQLLRKKRQAALLMAGLMIGSAVISSSLIVGDSLDQTVREEVEAAWGETDLLISGFDATSDKWSKSLSRLSLTFETQILKALAISNQEGSSLHQL